MLRNSFIAQDAIHLSIQPLFHGACEINNLFQWLALNLCCSLFVGFASKSRYNKNWFYVKQCQALQIEISDENTNNKTNEASFSLQNPCQSNEFDSVNFWKIHDAQFECFKNGNRSNGNNGLNKTSHQILMPIFEYVLENIAS